MRLTVKGVLVLMALWGLTACMSGTSANPVDDGGNGDGDGGGASGGGGGGGVGVTPPPFTSELFIATDLERQNYDTIFLPAVSNMATASVAGGVRAPFDDLPGTGSMTYDGFMELVIGSSVASANVAGPSTMTLTLSDMAITGSATGFMGTAIDENLEERLVNYAGTIMISNGQVHDNGAGDAGVSLDIDGSLDSGLHVFGVDGTLVGYLYGTDAEGMRARGSNTGIDGSMATTVDGLPGLIGVGTVSATAQPTSP